MPREDRIVIKGLLLNGKHGVLPQEQMHCQPFKVDITLGVNSLLPAAEKDDLALTVDYGAVIDVATNVVASSPKQLVETLAESISRAILAAFPEICWVWVRLVKTRPPLAAQVAEVGVEILRRRKQNE